MPLLLLIALIATFLLDYYAFIQNSQNKNKKHMYIHPCTYISTYQTVFNLYNNNPTAGPCETITPKYTFTPLYISTQSTETLPKPPAREARHQQLQSQDAATEDQEKWSGPSTPKCTTYRHIAYTHINSAEKWYHSPPLFITVPIENHPFEPFF